jgi:hypothetical protein
VGATLITFPLSFGWIHFRATTGDPTCYLFFFWGVEVFQSNGQEYVAASDRDSGLWIFRYTGD